MGYSLLGIRDYERNSRGQLEWVEDGWVSEIWPWAERRQHLPLFTAGQSPLREERR